MPDDGETTMPDDGDTTTMPDDGEAAMPDVGGPVGMPLVPYIPHTGCARSYGWAYGPRGCL
ncbi:hypothetical protein D3C78_1973460 [compost metagenome]